MKWIPGLQDERGFTDQSEEAAFDGKMKPNEMPEETNHNLFFMNQIN